MRRDFTISTANTVSDARLAGMGISDITWVT